MLKRNYLNYIGAKDKLIPQIKRELDNGRHIFVDAFCGSGVVSENVIDIYNNIVMNDACWQLMKIHNHIINKDIEDVLRTLDKYCKEYGLSKTNKEGFLKAREDYNNLYCSGADFDPLLLYLLITHSFNYSMHFNSKNGFSVPFGANRSSFNSSLRAKLVEFNKSFKDKNVELLNMSFNSLTEYILKSLDIDDTIVYLDPPYLSSDSSYSRIHGLKWTEEHERNMYSFLDVLNSNNVHFLLSNVFENNGKSNDILKEWSKKYNVVKVDMSYKGCNYQRKNNGETVEVLVKNY